MKISFNDVVETLAPAIADKLNLRAVMDCYNGNTMLIDFSSCGEPFSGDTVCVWSLQCNTCDADGNYCGTDEIDCGSFVSLFDVFMFVLGQAMVDGKELYVESF